MLVNIDLFSLYFILEIEILFSIDKIICKFLLLNKTWISSVIW